MSMTEISGFKRPSFVEIEEYLQYLCKVWANEGGDNGHGDYYL